MKQKSMFLNLKNILHRDATDGCSAVISPKAPSERGSAKRWRRLRKERFKSLYRRVIKSFCARTLPHPRSSGAPSTVSLLFL